ncbi:piggyBac transposable element-derived protein 4-like [Penaeus indicus]|uniref:piggyBac transposable element-derived protein 4-like n=1 Tax=Penaeus indicus TaxID=29960 RepID=UPI00300CC4DE
MMEVSPSWSSQMNGGFLSSVLFSSPSKKMQGSATLAPSLRTPRSSTFSSGFFDNALIDDIVQQSNAYHEYLMNKDVYPPSSRMHQGKPIDINEMRIFLCLCMAMAHVKKHRINDYWSTDFLISTPIFGTIMSRDRFLLILRHLHFSDNQNDANHRLSKIGRVMIDIRHKFSTKFKPFQDLCIDESLVLWRGRLVFRQYMPNKRHRFGLKLFLICDVETGIILDFILYTGAQTEVQVDSKFGFAGSIVNALIEPYLGKGHNLFTDSYYASPILFEHLQQNSTGACGTVRPNRKGVPSFPAVNRGEVSACHKNNMMCFKWSAKRMVHMLTSIHKNEIIQTEKRDYSTGEPIRKPEAVVDYTRKMRIIDKADMLLSCVDSLRKSIKWYKILFFHIVDMARLNSYYMYLVKTGNRPSFLEFNHTMLHQMLVRYREQQVRTPH